MRDWAHSRRLGTPADEAGYVVLRQPPASELANLFRIDAWNHALGLVVTQQLGGRVTVQAVLLALCRLVDNFGRPDAWQRVTGQASCEKGTGGRQPRSPVRTPAHLRQRLDGAAEESPETLRGHAPSWGSPRRPRGLVGTLHPPP